MKSTFLRERTKEPQQFATALVHLAFAFAAIIITARTYVHSYVGDYSALPAYLLALLFLSFLVAVANGAFRKQERRKYYLVHNLCII